MREIPKLQILCLRVIGAHSCSADETFASDPKTGQPSKASQLLREFHKRPVILSTDDNQVCLDVTTKHMEEEKEKTEKEGEEEEDTDDAGKEPTNRTILHVPLPRTLCVGQVASRRAQANEVDLAHPLLAHRYSLIRQC